jgi:hypothetical protein
LPDTELEGASTEQRRLEERDRRGHGPKTGRSAVVEWGEGREQRRFEDGDRGGRGPKMGRSAVVEWGEGREQRRLEDGDRGGRGPKPGRSAITRGGGRGFMLQTECRATNETWLFEIQQFIWVTLSLNTNCVARRREQMRSRSDSKHQMICEPWLCDL